MLVTIPETQFTSSIRMRRHPPTSSYFALAFLALGLVQNPICSWLPSHKFTDGSELTEREWPEVIEDHLRSILLRF